MANFPPPSQSFENKEPAILSENRNVLMVIERSKNANIVVYEALFDANGQFRSDKPCDVYWLSIDPANVAAARAKGKLDDRDELNFIEKTMAYGVKHYAGQRPNEPMLKLVALDKPVVLVMTSEGPRVIIELNGRRCYLRRIYVKSLERTLRLPKVEYVDLLGFDIETGELVLDRVIP